MQVYASTEFNEYEMFMLYKNTGDHEVKDSIVEHYMYIVEILSKRFANRGLEYDDIFQVACIGLILAVDRFDPGKNIKFASFATPTVLGEIKKHFRDKGYFIKIPRKLYEVFYRAERLRQKLAPDKCSPEEISRILKLPVETVKKAYEFGDIAFIRSLEQEAYANGQASYLDTLGCDDKSFLMIENADFVSSCFKALNDKEQDFIKLRYYNEYTQKQISKLWHVSQMNVSRFEKKVLKKLRDLYFN